MMSPNLDALIEVHMDLIQALVKLTKNLHLPTVIKAMHHLYNLVHHIASNTQKKDYNKILDCKKKKIFNQLYPIEIWIPVLSSLSILYSDTRVEVQYESVKTLFSLLQEFGPL